MGTMHAGRLRDRVILQSPISAQDTSGRPVTSWFDHDTVWAEVKDIASPSEEAVEDGIGLAKRESWVTIRWRNDISANMRLIVLNESRTLRIITPPAEMDSRQWLKFKVEELTTGGQEP